MRAFHSFYKAECMFGTADAIAGAITEQLGSPYTEFPFLMFRYGGGGIDGWGTICGTLAGAAACFHLLSSKPGPLVDALFVWYESEALPNVHPKAAKFPEIRSVSGTPLCHTSISKWCSVSGKHTYSPERGERCAALAASVAKKAVMLLNEQAAAKPIAFPCRRQPRAACPVTRRAGRWRTRAARWTAEAATLHSSASIRRNRGWFENRASMHMEARPLVSSSPLLHAYQLKIGRELD